MMENNNQTMGEIEKKRGGLLTFWIILMLLSNGIGALFYFFGAGFISIFLPETPLWSIYFLGTLSFLNFIFTIFLFRWKKWAFFALLGNSVVAIIIHTSINTGIFSFVGLLEPLIHYLIMRPKWKLFE